MAARIRHVQLYDVARTAHFERALSSGAETVILYRSRRYDFDEALAARVGARRAGVVGAFWYLLRHDVDVLEAAEPLLAHAAARTLAAITGARLRRLRGGPRTVTTAYAIENKDPRESLPHLSVRARLSLRAHLILAAAVWRRVDRIAYGTPQSADLYARCFRGRRRPREQVVPALPAAQLDPVADEPRDPVIAFLGDFSDRKGLPLVLSAWQRVRVAEPRAHLRLIGKGEHHALVTALAETDDRVEAIIDPPRERIFAELEAARVLTLPSQPRPRWREQVGLPIVEGLGRGCVVVASDETGLAPWLRAHGHHIYSPAGDAAGLADALLAGLADARTPAGIVADLPAEDGRVAAERWMLSAAAARG